MICSTCVLFCVFFFFKQKTAYEMRISDWSSDVCSSDLQHGRRTQIGQQRGIEQLAKQIRHVQTCHFARRFQMRVGQCRAQATRSEEHTSELQSLMRISYAVFCLKKKTKIQTNNHTQHNIIDRDSKTQKLHTHTTN